MKIKPSNSKKSWNSGRAIGPKTEFTLPQTKQIEQYLLVETNWHDLALMSMALDSLLRSGDLLQTKVKDVAYSSGNIRTELRHRQQKTDHNVFPVLTKGTRDYLEIWIQVSGKSSNDFLFTRTKRKNEKPITRGHYASLVKTWATWLGLPTEEYSTHSLRRSKPCWMFEKGEQLETISKLLGHKSTEVTLRYLGIDQKRAAAAALRHPMTQGPPAEILQQFGRNRSTSRPDKPAKTVKSI